MAVLKEKQAPRMLNSKWYDDTMVFVALYIKLSIMVHVKFWNRLPKYLEMHLSVVTDHRKSFNSKDHKEQLLDQS